MKLFLIIYKIQLESQSESFTENNRHTHIEKKHEPVLFFFYDYTGGTFYLLDFPDRNRSRFR